MRHLSIRELALASFFWYPGRNDAGLRLLHQASGCQLQVSETKTETLSVRAKSLSIKTDVDVNVH